MQKALQIDEYHRTAYNCQYIVYVSTKYRQPHLVGENGERFKNAVIDMNITGVQIFRTEILENMVELHCTVSPGLSVTHAIKGLLRQSLKAIGLNSSTFARSMYVTTQAANESHLQLVSYLDGMKRYHGDKKRGLS